MKIGRLFWSACPFRQPPHRFRGAWGLALWSPSLTHRRYQQAIRVANAWRPTIQDLARVGIVDALNGEARRAMARGEA